MLMIEGPDEEMIVRCHKSSRLTGQSAGNDLNRNESVENPTKPHHF